MNELTYEVIESVNPITGETITNVLRSDGALIPSDPANSDYQAYLNPDKVEHLTEIPTSDEA